MQTKAETWTDGNGITWSFAVNGTKATNIKFDHGPIVEKIYLYGGPDNPDQQPFVPGAWDAAAMRFSYTDGAHLPTIPDDVYFSLKTLIFDVSDVTSDFDLKVMNGWWSNTYYDHVKWENGLNELQITEVMANECAKGGEARDLDLMLYSGSMTFNAVYYESSTVSGDLEIPSKVYVGSTELTVTSVGDHALAGNPDLTSVTIPEGVTSIGNSAFFGCAALMSVNIPSGVTSIGNSAFYNCYGLTSVDIPSGVTVIGDYAFYNCYTLTSVTIPSGVTVIGDYAFYNCVSLTNVNIPSGMTSIGDHAFYYCPGLTNVNIPSGVTSIGDYAFYGCAGLTSVNIPSSVTSIGRGPFGGSRLTSISVESGNAVYDSRNNCNAIIETATNTLIQGCNNTIIPEGVTSIGDDAFASITNLTSLTIPEGVTSIGISAFNSCYKLTSLTIPSSVTSIGANAFFWCYGLTSISVESGNSVYDSRNNCNAIIETATNTLIQGCNNTIIPEDVTKIGSCAFYACTGLTNVTIPSSVTTIGNLAFYHCSSLTSVTSLIKEPFVISYDVFMDYDNETWNSIFTPATLYVPEGTKSLYEATYAWSQFQNIVEMGGGDGIQSPIDHPTLTIDGYYTPDGRKIEGTPTKKGLYIVNGRKVVIK